MRNLLLYILFLGSISAYTQNQKLFIKAGDDRMQAGDYYGATLHYRSAMNYDSTNIDLMYKLAESYRLYNQYPEAEYYYQKIYDKEYGKLYPKGVFWLATMQKYNGKYREAIKTWKKVNSLYSRDKKNYEYLKSKQEIRSCTFAFRNEKREDENAEVINFFSVNTINAEMAPLKTADGFYFTSLRGEMNESLEVNAKDYRHSAMHYNGETTLKLDTIINKPGTHNGNFSFTSDFSRVYFSRCNDDYQCKILTSTRIANSWTQPEELNSEINVAGYNTTQPHWTEASGKEYLFFVSDRTGGQGMLDIWYSELKDYKTGMRATNAGKLVNSPDNEISPFYDTEKAALYFSSTWHEGFGGFDIFKSEGEIGNFSQPENLMKPINSQWNDYYFTPADSNSSYLASNRTGALFSKGPHCCNDIWKIQYPYTEPPKPLITNLEDLNRYLPVTLFFHNDEPNPRTTDTVTKLNYLTTYDAYRKLIPTYRAEYAKGLNEEAAVEAEMDIVDFFEDRVEKGVKDLTLFTSLLVEELEKGQHIELTIKGFASPLAKTDYNVKLTGRRISSLINYLNEYEGGRFKPYIDGTAENGGKLTFVRIPFGEYTANELISDNPNDQKNSIYSRAAASERKIEVQSVQQAARDSLYAEIKASKEVHDLGKLKPGEIVKHSFTITNGGNAPMQIAKVVPVCDCIKILNYPTKELKAGESASVEVEFNTTGLNAKQVHSVTIVANAFPRTKRLVITAEIME
ncbi:MAG: DUF1573 domain-containing protein [Flavobacteriales bacterium]